MKITSAVFVKSATENENLIRDELPQIAFIGRSNVGKSTLINTLTNNKKLVRHSSKPGSTQEINFFAINNAYYFVDLPGYGYAKGPFEKRSLITERIQGYLFDTEIIHHTIVLIIDARVGMTESDQDMFRELLEQEKHVVIIANKIDQLNQSEKHKNLKAIEAMASPYPVIPFSSTKRIGVEKLFDVLFGEA